MNDRKEIKKTFKVRKERMKEKNYLRTFKEIIKKWKNERKKETENERFEFEAFEEERLNEQVSKRMKVRNKQAYK